MSSKLAKKLPKRTGKAQKVRMMENSKRQSAEKKKYRQELQVAREERNNRYLRDVLGVNVNVLTNTARRKLLYKSKVS